jgi:hypothetical protein
LPQDTRPEISMWHTTLMAKSLILSEDKRSAFKRGLWKGIGAPWMLFSSFDLPPEAQPLDFTPLAKSQHSSKEDDWVRVGNALRVVIAKERAKRCG